MKKGLLGSTAIIGAAALVGGVAAYAAEAPEWKLSGNMNFQFYNIDQDFNVVDSSWTTADGSPPGPSAGSGTWVGTDGNPGIQDHGWYFGVDEAELQLNVSGTADNGLNYGFKIELQTNTSDSTNADEARISLSGGWGTLHLGDEDGAEDTMNYGGEDLMGATGGFDGDFDDVLLRIHSTYLLVNNAGAPSYPSIAGDTGDSTKVTYYSPRFSGFQVGASITPTPNGGDNFKSDGTWENHYGLGANYDNTFGNLHIQGSAVYSAASSNITSINDIAAWSVGGIVGWGSFSIGANYTDNGDSGSDTGVNTLDTSYWNVAAGFETGPLYFSAGYFASEIEYGPGWGSGFEATFENIALTADYTAAPGLGFYAEVNLISDEYDDREPGETSDATILILGANVSF